VAGQLKTAVSVHDAAKSIEKLDPSDVLLGVAGLVRSVAGPSKFSLFLLKDGVLEGAIQEGWTDGDDFPSRYAATSEIFQEVIGRQRMLCVTSSTDELILRGEGVLAAPVVVAETGQIVGMLKIEKVGFLDLNFSSVQTFRALCEWIGTAYGNACRYQTAKTDSMTNDQTELFSYSFLARQLTVLTQLAERVGFDLAMIMIELKNAHELDETARAAIPAALSRVVSRVLRKTDLAFDYQRTGFEFAILLPCASSEGARFVAGKLCEGLEIELNEALIKPVFHTRIHALHESKQAATVPK
jgi:GGDEF domain-containing protein